MAPARPGRSESLKSSTAASIRRRHEINTASFLGKASNEGNDEKATDTMVCSPATVSFHRCQRQEHSSASQLAVLSVRPAVRPPSRRRALLLIRGDSPRTPRTPADVHSSVSRTPGSFFPRRPAIPSPRRPAAARRADASLLCFLPPRNFQEDRSLRVPLSPLFDLARPN